MAAGVGIELHAGSGAARSRPRRRRERRARPWRPGRGARRSASAREGSRLVFRTSQRPPCMERAARAKRPTSRVNQSTMPVSPVVPRSVKSGSKKVPVGDSGTPRTTLPSAAPRKTARRALETPNTTSQKGRQTDASSRWLRNSRAIPAPHQEPEHDHEGQEEAAEARRVEAREREHQDPARREQPDLVAVPEGPDRLQDRGAGRPRPGRRRGAATPAPRSKPSSTT